MFSLLFIDTERVWRGGQDQLLALLQGLHRRGHRIQLVCHPNTLLESRARDSGIAVYPLRNRSEVGLVFFFRLLLTIRRIRPQILAFNTPKAILLGTLASRLSSVRARIIFRRVNFPLRKGFFTLVKYTWGIDCVIAISESIRLQMEIGGVPGSKIKTIYEGMDLSMVPKLNRAVTRRRGDPAVVGTVAHLSPEKGLQYLIEAASLIPGVQKRLRFIIVGDGECLKELEQLAKSKGLSDIFEFAGFHSDASQHMRSFDIFVLPSLSEGLSSAILEAMASSLPIVATNVGGIPELVTNGDNGLLVAPADSAALALAIQRLAENPDESIRMGLRGRERIEKQFTLERKISETEKLCSLLIKESAHPVRL
jgi:glycosyltransferase involved in cell wall biosynthesis